MNYEEFKKLISEITYKPFFKIECNHHEWDDAVAITISIWQPNIETTGLLKYWESLKLKYFSGRVFIKEDYVKLSATHRITLQYLKQMSERQVLEKIREWLIFYEKHECDEWFKHKGVQVNDPH